MCIATSPTPLSRWLSHARTRGQTSGQTEREPRGMTDRPPAARYSESVERHVNRSSVVARNRMTKPTRFDDLLCIPLLESTTRRAPPPERDRPPLEAPRTRDGSSPTVLELPHRDPERSRANSIRRPYVSHTASMECERHTATAGRSTRPPLGPRHHGISETPFDGFILIHRFRSSPNEAMRIPPLRSAR